MKIRQNLHIHSSHSCDSACIPIANIIKEMESFGVEHYALTDHLHTAYNLPDIASARNDFLRCCPPENFHFGIEVSCVTAFECEEIARGNYTAWGDTPVFGLRYLEDFDGRMAIGITEDDVKKYGIELVVAGVHWPLGYPKERMEVIENYFQQHMFLIAHPLVDVLAHPWDSITLAAGDWYHFRDQEHIDRTIYRDIPKEYSDRMAQELIKYNKPAEINFPVVASRFAEERKFYLDMLTDWKEQGVKFTLGDDLHYMNFSKDQFIAIEQMLTDRGFTDEDFVLPFKKKN